MLDIPVPLPLLVRRDIRSPGKGRLCDPDPLFAPPVSLINLCIGVERRRAGSTVAEKRTKAYLSDQHGGTLLIAVFSLSNDLAARPSFTVRDNASESAS